MDKKSMFEIKNPACQGKCGRKTGTRGKYCPGEAIKVDNPWNTSCCDENFQNSSRNTAKKLTINSKLQKLIYDGSNQLNHNPGT